MEQARVAHVRLNQTPAPVRARGERGIIKYANRIQGFAYGGAAVLVVIIGLRSVYGRAIPSWVVISGLLLEATLLLMIAAVYYLTPEELGGAQPSTNSQILNGEKEILSLLRNQIMQGEGEILNVLRNDLLTVQKEIASALRRETELRSEGQKNLTAALHRESDERKHQQEELLQSLQKSADATQQQLHALNRIDEQITLLLKEEVDTIVKAKMQEIFSTIVRKNVDTKLNQRLDG